MVLNPPASKTEKDTAANQLDKLLAAMFTKTDGNPEDPRAVLMLLEKMATGVTLRDIGEQLVKLNRQRKKLKDWLEED